MSKWIVEGVDSWDQKKAMEGKEKEALLIFWLSYYVSLIMIRFSYLLYHYIVVRTRITHLCIYTYIHIYTHIMCIYIYIYIHVYIYIYMYVCICVYIYIYIYIHNICAGRRRRPDLWVPHEARREDTATTTNNNENTNNDESNHNSNSNDNNSRSGSKPSN